MSERFEGSQLQLEENLIPWKHILIDI